jgi:hypothetical protein
LKEIQDYLKTANYTAQQPQLEGSTALKDSKLFFLDGDENSKETDKKETTITVYLDGFKPEATKIWTTILAPYHAKVLPHKKDTEVSISHDGKTLYVFYKNRLFLALPADESRANDLQKDLKRIFYAIQLVKQWSQFHQTTSALQTNILLFQKKSYIPLQGETIEIGSGIRIQILSTKLCYPVVFNLTNEGQMLVIHPYPQNEPITRIHKTITIPPKGKFRVKEPKGLGLIMAFCSAKKSDVEMLRKRIIRGKYKPPSYLNSRVQRNIISYYVQ